MQRAILVTAVFLGSTFLGWSSAKRLRLRRDTLRAMTDSIKRLLMLMAYTHQPLHQLVERCATGAAEPALAAFAAALKERERAQQAWQTAEDWALLHDRGFAALHPGDRETLRSFMGVLGTADLNRQQQSAAMAVAALEQSLSDAEAACSSKGRVYRAMGVLCGAAVSILLL